MVKDFFVEIRKSLGRFLSIFFIVALGVSLFVGIRATEPDMRLSGDAYVDENKLSSDLKAAIDRAMLDFDRALKRQDRSEIERARTKLEQFLDEMEYGMTF